MPGVRGITFAKIENYRVGLEYSKEAVEDVEVVIISFDVDEVTDKDRRTEECFSTTDGDKESETTFPHSL
jgi:hypothetical protein